MSGHLHATAVARNEDAVLIKGSAGAGKSALALSLLTLGARLVADDLTHWRDAGDHVELSQPSGRPGLIEARGIGLINLGQTRPARLKIVVDLDRPAPARLPVPEFVTFGAHSFRLIAGQNMPHLAHALWLLLDKGSTLEQD